MSAETFLRRGELHPRPVTVVTNYFFLKRHFSRPDELAKTINELANQGGLFSKDEVASISDLVNRLVDIFDLAETINLIEPSCSDNQRAREEERRKVIYEAFQPCVLITALFSAALTKSSGPIFFAGGFCIAGEKRESGDNRYKDLFKNWGPLSALPGAATALAGDPMDWVEAHEIKQHNALVAKYLTKTEAVKEQYGTSYEELCQKLESVNDKLKGDQAKAVKEALKIISVMKTIFNPLDGVTIHLSREDDLAFRMMMNQLSNGTLFHDAATMRDLQKLG